MDFQTEDQIGMSNILQVHWTIKPTSTPKPILPCSRCGAPRPFSFSGKARLNANGSRLDAWLIYHCVGCNRTWNRPLFGRQQRGSIDDTTLAALHSNDCTWLEVHAYDMAALRRHTSEIEFGGGKQVIKMAVSRPQSACLSMSIDIRTIYAVGARPDQLLSAELEVSRTRLEGFVKDGRLVLLPERKNGLRWPLPPNLNATLNLEGLSDADEILRAAVT